jgi:hypothetical protein
MFLDTIVKSVVLSYVTKKTHLQQNYSYEIQDSPHFSILEVLALHR